MALLTRLIAENQLETNAAQDAMRDEWRRLPAEFGRYPFLARPDPMLQYFDAEVELFQVAKNHIGPKSVVWDVGVFSVAAAKLTFS